MGAIAPRKKLSDGYCIVFYGDFTAILDFADVNFVYEWDFADYGADCNDCFGFLVYHAKWCCAVFSSCGITCSFRLCCLLPLWEHEDFAFDAYALEFMAFFEYDACVGVYAAVEN